MTGREFIFFTNNSFAKKAKKGVKPRPFNYSYPRRQTFNCVYLKKPPIIIWK